MPRFDVIIRGPHGFLESGQYESAFRTNTYDASKDILNDLQDKGYVRLSNTDGSCSVVVKDAVMTFSVKEVEE